MLRRLFFSHVHSHSQTSYIYKCTPISLLNGFNHRRVLLFSSTGEVTSKDSMADFLVGALGLTEQQSHTTFTKLTRVRTSLGRTSTNKNASEFNFPEKAISVVTFLEQSGLDLSHIRMAVAKEPRILLAKLEKTLKPKVNLLSELGFRGSDLMHIISANPFILGLRLEPAIQTLREFVGSDEDVIKVVKKMKWRKFSSISKNLLPNVALLESEYGMTRDKVRKYFLQQPTGLLVNADTFKSKLVRVGERWGIGKDSAVFLYAAYIIGYQSEEMLESRIQVFRSYGWTEPDIRALVTRNPFCLAYKGERIEKSLGFLMNELGYEPGYLVSHVTLLTFSLDKRIMPRHKALLVLKEKGLLNKDYTLYQAVSVNESNFLKRFIEPFKNDVPGLLEEYKNSMASAVRS